MRQRNRLEAQAENIERRFVDQVHVQLRHVSLALAIVEHVSENPFDDGEGGTRSVDRDAAALMVVERADVVEAEDVIGVPVRVNDGVQTRDAGPQHLGAEIGRGVDDDIAVRRN